MLGFSGLRDAAEHDTATDVGPGHRVGQHTHRIAAADYRGDDVGDQFAALLATLLDYSSRHPGGQTRRKPRGQNGYKATCYVRTDISSDHSASNGKPIAVRRQTLVVGPFRPPLSFDRIHPSAY